MADGSSFNNSWSFSGDPSLIAAAENYMNQTFNWGMQEFGKVSQVTDQIVGDMMNLYGQLSGVGNDLMGMYKGMFMPEYQNLVNDANNYASAARIQQAMGAAEAGVSQSFNSQRNAALADLQSFGIDPSSGRYAALDQTERLQQAAAQAGAGFQAEQATEATGRALRSEALQLGSVLPSQATAAYNAAGQAAGAGANIKMATAQLGSNLIGKPTDWAKIGMEGRQAGSSGGSKSNKDPNSGKSSNRGDDYNNRPPTPDKTYDYQGANQKGGGGGDGSGRDPGDLKLPGGDYLDNQTAGITQVKQDQPPASNGPIDISAGSPYDPAGTDNWDPSGRNLNGPTTPPSTEPAPEEGSGSGDPWENTGPGTQAGPSDQGTDLGGNVDTAGNTDYSNMDFSGGSGSGDTPDNGGNSSFDDTGSNDFAGDPGTSPSDTGSDFSQDEESFAKGGAIPYSKSPSRGRVTDDVPAKVKQTGEDIRVNAGEWIMPRDVRHWYGDKHLQGMIDKARADRQSGSAKPTPRPPLPSQRGAIPMARR